MATYMWDEKPFNCRVQIKRNESEEFKVTPSVTCNDLGLNGKREKPFNKTRGPFSCILSNSANIMSEPCSSPDYLILLEEKGFWVNLQILLQMSCEFKRINFYTP